MADENSLTKKDILNLLHDLWTDVAYPQVQEMVTNVRDELVAGQKNLQRQISELKSDTPSRKEFEDLKNKMDQYQKSN